jgi:hypothetical protein
MISIMPFKTFYFSESFTTLKDLYPEEPEDSERIWDYWKSDRGEKYEIQEMPSYKLRDLLINGENILDFYEDRAKPEQKKLVRKYVRKDPGGVVIMDGDRIIDGHHRIVAAILAGRSVKYINVGSGDEEELEESARKKKHRRRGTWKSSANHPRDILPVTNTDDSNMAWSIESNVEDAVNG